MDWIEVANAPVDNRVNMKKLQKFTLYDHNYVYNIDQQAQTFNCLLNCKRLNRLYSSICQIDGDLKAGQVSISCRLLDQQHIVHGQWEFQRIELTRFAFRYNERSYRNIFIRTNPLNGEVTATLAFMTGPGIIEDQQKFRQIMTDLCHIVGQQSEMMFNTMLEIIFGRQANQPYLKSGIKVNPGFPRYMKVQKLLDKIKSLIATSSFYKIRSDISSAHKNRSYFKKIYLNQDKKMVSKQKILQMALAYEVKFNKRYEQVQKKQRERPQQFIKDYIELEQKNQIQFAKHLNEGVQFQYTQPTISPQSIINIAVQGNNLFTLTFANNTKMRATATKFEARAFAHQLSILKQINMRHPNICEHIVPINPPAEIVNWIFYHYEEEILLTDFLRKNSRTICLSTKLHIMVQVCSVFQYLHKRNIGYFIEMENIYITRGLEVRIKGFQRSYSVQGWVDNRKDTDEKIRYANMIMSSNDMKVFPYRFIVENDLDNEKCDVLSLGVCLYRILMDKFPFDENNLRMQRDRIGKEDWSRLWTVETQYFLCKGGEIVKIIAHLLLKCFDNEHISNRPYVQWLLVILCEVRTSLNGLY